MLRLVVNKGFERAGIERVELYVYAWNAAAIRTSGRLGFLYEGTQRSLVRVGSERWDTIVMTVLRGEWPGLQTRRMHDGANEPKIMKLLEED